MTKLVLKNISKSFDDKAILENINLSVEKGKILALLGPSGSGKSTILNIISGLLEPEDGDVFFNGQRVNEKKAEDRQVGMVFQQYLLFPHMNVSQNIEFGLKMAKVNKAIRQEKTENMIAMMQLHGLENRMPAQLSGGQQQRVAMGRTLIMEPKILLMDEPLANLDARLRDEMRLLIKDLQHKMQVTTIFVTHDQMEAFELADQIALLQHGELQQVGTAQEIYNYPLNKEVAQFVGFENFIMGHISACQNNQYIFDSQIGKIEGIYLKKSYKIDDKGYLAFRSHNVYLEKPEQDDYISLVLDINYMSFKGQYYLLTGHINMVEIKAQLKERNMPMGNNIRLYIRKKDIHFIEN